MNDATQVTRQARSDGDGQAQAALLPPVDVYEDASGITMQADLPGVTKEKLELRIEGDTLILDGEVALTLPEGMEATHAEVQLPRYRRVFTLSKELDTEQVKAELRHGVLTLRIPKAPHAQPRRIEVQVH
ncbi:MAG TPA: Hsp20/alpha crystallin family protein [Gammaproteobacteria bacterium]|nr:Hsp20/alpha crystallin family protein [Gammaproteobacteria bacterium]